MENIFLIIVLLIVPFAAHNKAYKLEDRVKELEKKIKNLEENKPS